MTLSFNIKVKAGKRTSVSVDVWFYSLTDKIITFKNNKTLKESDIANWIRIQLYNKLKEVENLE